MLPVPFNGQVLITQKYRGSKDPKGPHYGTDYAIQHRTAIVAPADGVVSMVEGDIAKKTKGIKSWLANTPTDPYVRRVGKVIVYRNLSTLDYGNFIKINHGNGVSTLMSHLDEIKVEAGQIVKEGEEIGYSDSTGNSTGNHLHYELRRNDVVIDPDTFDYAFKGSVATSDAISTAANKVITQDFIDKRLKEFHGSYWPCKEVVRVKSDGDFSRLNVRNRPSTKEGLLSGFTRTFLKPGEIFNAIYFGRGQSVEGNDLWWMSEYGNFVSSIGTTVVPDPERGGDNVKKQEKKDLITELTTEKNTLEERTAIVEGRISEVSEISVSLSPSPSQSVAPAPEIPEEEIIEPTSEPVKDYNERLGRLEKFLSALGEKFGVPFK